MKIEVDLATLNVITAALRGHQAAIEGVLQNMQVQVAAANTPLPADVTPIKSETNEG